MNRTVSIRRSGRRAGRVAWVVTPLLVGAAAATFFLGELGTVAGFEFGSAGQELKALGVLRGDFDGDGLSDVQETVLGTRIDQADTDGDGASDLLELARQTDPLDANEWPDSSSLRVGIAGRVEGAVAIIVTAVFVPAGGLPTTNVGFGIVVRGVQTPLSTASVLGSSELQINSVGTSTDSVLVIESQVPAVALHALSGAAFYATDSRVGLPMSVAVFQTLSFPGTDANGDPMPMLVRPEDPPPGVGPLNSSSGFSGNSGNQQFNRGTVYRPLSGDEDIPTDWSTGQICYQEMHPVGVNGISIVYEVDSASCEAFDTFCSPSSCLAGVGQDVEIVDPGAIVGG